MRTSRGARAGIAVVVGLGLLAGCANPAPWPPDGAPEAPPSPSATAAAAPEPTPNAAPSDPSDPATPPVEPVESSAPVDPAPAGPTSAAPPAATVAPAPPAPSPTADVAAGLRSAVDALNAARADAGTPALVRHDGLTALAQSQADHYGRGGTEWDGDLGAQLAAVGFATGSVLARNGGVAGDIGGAVAAWLADGDSRATLTDPGVGAVGLAQATLPDGRPMVVVVVGYRADDGSIPAASQGAAEALEATNAERAAFGLPSLTISEDLNRAAQGQADHQASILQMTHEGNGGLGARLGAVGYRSGAENVAAGQRSVGEVVQGWIDSPGHHANIVNPDMTEVGFAVAFGADGRSYWAQVFGTR